MPGASNRRRFGRIVLVLLILLHLGAFGLYVLRQRQSQLLMLYLDARDQWREGHLDIAAREYRTFVEARPTTAWPVVLFRNFPDAASAWFALGRVEAERGRVDAALDAFARSMALVPGRGRREYRDLLLRSHRGATLVEFARAEARADPGSPAAACDLGAGLLAVGQPGAAVAAYDRALTLLPAWLRVTDPAAPAGLSGEEADLLNLLSVAARLAGQVARADAACASVSNRQSASARLDRLCLAYRLAADGDRAGATRLLAGYAPPAPEHEALALALSVSD